MNDADSLINKNLNNDDGTIYGISCLSAPKSDQFLSFPCQTHDTKQVEAYCDAC